MSTPTNPRPESAHRYFVQNRPNEELVRLQVQDQMLIVSMGGVLPEQPDPLIFQRVLDVGCGTGDWLIEAAETYPSMSRLLGVDVSTRMVEHAQMRAKAQGVSDRVQFRAMDVLGPLDFPDNSFNLVNQCLGTSYLRTWDWPELLRQYQRVTRPGGVIRITEIDGFTPTNSQALLRLDHLLLQAFYQAGHFFTSESHGMTSQLTRLLQQSGLRQVQTYAFTLEYRAGTPEGSLFHEDMKQLYRIVMPFLRKWTQFPQDYETIYQHMLSETQQPGFVATCSFLTAWGNVPPKEEENAPLSKES